METWLVPFYIVVSVIVFSLFCMAPFFFRMLCLQIRQNEQAMVSEVPPWGTDVVLDSVTDAIRNYVKVNDEDEEEVQGSLAQGQEADEGHEERGQGQNSNTESRSQEGHQSRVIYQQNCHLPGSDEHRPNRGPELRTREFQPSDDTDQTPKSSLCVRFSTSCCRPTTSDRTPGHCAQRPSGPDSSRGLLSGDSSSNPRSMHDTSANPVSDCCRVGENQSTKNSEGGNTKIRRSNNDPESADERSRRHGDFVYHLEGRQLQTTEEKCATSYWSGSNTQNYEKGHGVIGHKDCYNVRPCEGRPQTLYDTREEHSVEGTSCVTECPDKKRHGMRRNPNVTDSVRDDHTVRECSSRKSSHDGIREIPSRKGSHEIATDCSCRKGSHDVIRINEYWGFVVRYSDSISDEDLRISAVNSPDPRSPLPRRPVSRSAEMTSEHSPLMQPVSVSDPKFTVEDGSGQSVIGTVCSEITATSVNRQNILGTDCPEISAGGANRQHVFETQKSEITLRDAKKQSTLGPENTEISARDASRQHTLRIECPELIKVDGCRRNDSENASPEFTVKDVCRYSVFGHSSHDFTEKDVKRHSVFGTELSRAGPLTGLSRTKLSQYRGGAADYTASSQQPSTQKAETMYEVNDPSSLRIFGEPPPPYSLHVEIGQNVERRKSEMSLTSVQMDTKDKNEDKFSITTFLTSAHIDDDKNVQPSETDARFQDMPLEKENLLDKDLHLVCGDMHTVSRITVAGTESNVGTEQSLQTNNDVEHPQLSRNRSEVLCQSDNGTETLPQSNDHVELLQKQNNGMKPLPQSKGDTEKLQQPNNGMEPLPQSNKDIEQLQKSSNGTGPSQQDESDTDDQPTENIPLLNKDSVSQKNSGISQEQKSLVSMDNSSPEGFSY